MTTPYDDLPLDMRRLNWGWWGDPWPSGICYDDDGRLIEEMRKPFPAGQSCFYCGEPFAEGDSGQSMPFAGHRCGRIINQHKECLLRQAMGSVSCMKGEHDHGSEGTLREGALATWHYLSQLGSGSGSMSA